MNSYEILLQTLQQKLGEHLEETINAALSPGPTEAEKGEVAALRWVLDLIEEETADTEAETGASSA